MFVACGIWCLADVSSVSPSSEHTISTSLIKPIYRHNITSGQTVIGELDKVHVQTFKAILQTFLT